MTDYISGLSDINLILLIIAAFLAAIQLFLLICMALRGASVTLWHGWVAIIIGVYLVLATR